MASRAACLSSFCVCSSVVQTTLLNRVAYCYFLSHCLLFASVSMDVFLCQ